MTASPSTRPGLRGLLRADAVFEGILTLGCLWLADRLPSTGAWALPTWLGRPALIVVALLLVVAVAALWWLSGRTDHGAVRMVAAANGVTAILVAVWAGLGAGSGGALRVLLVVVALVLAVLAGAQWRLVRTGRRRLAPSAG